MKIRINDLARELEVKSKAILDVLLEVGVTEKKTHSSSLEEDEARKVRAHFRSGSDAPAPAKPSRPNRPASDEIETKIDLSQISRPGDVLKAIISRQQQPPAATPAAKPVTPVNPPTEVRTTAPAPTAAKRTTVVSPGAPTAPPRLIVPDTGVRRTFTVPPPAAPSPKPTETKPVEMRPVAVPTPPRPPVATQSSTPTASGAPSQAPTVRPGAPIASRPQTPSPRMIMPQTGPRPVYKAPMRPAGAAPTQQQPGATMRPAPGRPVPGQPIFQRSRPGTAAPGTRPPMRPGERRPMHPTRQSPTGTRPLGVGPGPSGAPTGPSRPGSRPGAPSRRPGQRYVPRGVKEGPMKGYVPPPRLSLSNEPQPITRNITINEGISVKDLAEKLEIRAKDLIARLLARGVFATINQTLDTELASEMARFFGADTNVISFEEQAAKEVSEAAAGEEGGTQEGVPRPPVVTIMGHVDHGKTTLLDSIRSTDIAGGEAGGITQHIGAYKVTIQDKQSPAYGRQIVFLDTPGHEAFTRMRSRGAKATDIVVLVVAADDGVMPQTIEAIDHAHAAEVPIIVAVNKVDKPDAMPDRVKKQLADRGLMPEDWGGTTVFVDVSAKQKTNLNLLMEMICLVADLQELKAVPERPATGVVLEAKLDRGRGPVATLLVQNGTLRAGDNFVVGNVYGKVRAMFDDRGNALEEAPPSTPVEILGMEGLPQAGDQFVAVADREKARGISNIASRNHAKQL